MLQRETSFSTTLPYSWHTAQCLPSSEPQAITRAVGHDQNLYQVMLHFVFASRIIYLGKSIDELFEQGDSSDHSGMVTLLYLLSLD